ncbi:MAG TPA: hypothetical protein VLF59_04670 [Candidatus Saccharimonadales bacterium]|nr:hypothetical protein [Candidatus Saccharimonadales bacterium]
MSREAPANTAVVDDEPRIGQVIAQAVAAIITTERIPLPGNFTDDPAELQSRAGTLEAKLEHTVRTSPFQERLEAAAQKSRLNKLGAAILAGDMALQAQYGLDLRGVRFDTVTRSLILGTPTELQATSSIIDYPQQPNTLNGATVGIGAVLHRIVSATGGALRTNLVTSYDPEHVGVAATSHHIMSMVTSMQNNQLLRHTDVLGRDVHFPLFSMNDTAALEPLKERLSRSRYGKVQTLGESLTSFVPYPEYAQFASRISGTSPGLLAKIGIPLHLAGHVFNNAVMAVDALDKEPGVLRINLEHMGNTSTYRQAIALGRFANNVGLERSQLILYESNQDVPAHMASLALAAAMLPHVRRFMRNNGRFAHPEQYDARQYFAHNYGPEVLKEQKANSDEPIIEGMHNEDFLCRTIAVRELSNRYTKYQFKDMVDAYCGPANSLARIMAPYICDKEKGGSILELDKSPSSIECQQAWIDGTLCEDDAATAKRDHELFGRTRVADRYDMVFETPDERARSLASAQIGDFVDLAAESCEVITDGYGTCSSGAVQENTGGMSFLPPTFEDFCAKQRIKYRALRPGGMTLSMHMVQRLNWEGVDVDSGEPIDLPSIYLMSAEEIEKAYLDAGFTNVFVKIVEVPNPHHKGQEEQLLQNAAMAVVIGDKPKAGSDHMPPKEQDGPEQI